MPTPVPDSLRAALGDEGADALVRWLDDYMEDHTARRDERPNRGEEVSRMSSRTRPDQGDPRSPGRTDPAVYREVRSRLDTMKERCHRIEGRIEHEVSPAKQKRRHYDGRTERMQDRLDRLEKQLNEHRHRVNMRLGRIRKEVHTQWFAGLAVFLGILVTVLGIAVFAA